MKIIGIDPGFGRCGFAILDVTKAKGRAKTNLKLESFGVITTKPQTDFAERLIEIAEDFQKLLKKHKPGVLSIEDLFFVQNITTGIRVAEVRGMLIFLAANFGCQICEPKPVEIKSCFTGNGKAGKNEMKKMAQMIFGLKSSPKVDDAADAIGAAYFAVQIKK